MREWRRLKRQQQTGDARGASTDTELTKENEAHNSGSVTQTVTKRQMHEVTPAEGVVREAHASKSTSKERPPEMSAPPALSPTSKSTGSMQAEGSTKWPARALKVHRQWADLILDGTKTWEMRGSATSIRGRVALAVTKTNVLVGDVEIVGCKKVGPAEFQASDNKHCVRDPVAVKQAHAYNELFAWILANPRRYKEPTPYPNPSGAVIWVLLQEPNATFASTQVMTPNNAAQSHSTKSNADQDHDPANGAPKTSARQGKVAKQPPSVMSLQRLQQGDLQRYRAYAAGMVNLGNTCFCNALLACLSSASPFLNRLLLHERQHGSSQATFQCLRCRLCNDLAQLSASGRTKSFIPATAQIMQDWAPDFAHGQQQCAGEAFSLLMQALDTEDLDSVAHCVEPSQVASIEVTAVAAESFAVQWTQTTRCLGAECKKASTQEAMNCGLQLELPPSEVTLLDLLERHFTAERIDDYWCDQCRRKGPCEVSKNVTRWPPLLFLHVKRFQTNAKGRVRKINDHLFFEDYFVSAQLGITYAVQAVAVHDGPYGRGHYYAFLRDSAGDWVWINDSAPPRRVPFTMVQQQQAYLLVLERKPPQ